MPRRAGIVTRAIGVRVQLLLPMHVLLAAMLTSQDSQLQASAFRPLQVQVRYERHSLKIHHTMEAAVSIGSTCLQLALVQH